MAESELTENKYIVFQLGDQLLAVPLMSANEVMECGDVRPVSRSKQFFNGVTNIRGEVVGVIDLRQRFDLESAEGASVLMVFEFPDYTLAAKVDRLVRVDEVDDSEIDPVRGVKNYVDGCYVQGMYERDGEMITVIDIKAFLNDDRVIAA